VQQFLSSLFSAQPSALFLVSGILFLAVAAVGSVKTYINPGNTGRIVSGAIGVVLIVCGLWLNAKQSANTTGKQLEQTATPPAIGTTPQDQSNPVPAHSARPSPHPHRTEAQPFNAADISTVCKFSAGLAAGHTYDYSPWYPGGPVGTSCTDGLNSVGIIIAKPDGPVPSGVSTVCRFNNGPANGTTHNYAPLRPLPLGAPCQDGQGSTGIIVLE